MTNIYEYIYDLLIHLSCNCEITTSINNNVMYSPKSLLYLNDRLNIKNNTLSFKLKTSDLELILEDKNNSSIININLINNNTTILLNNNKIYNKYTPLIVNNKIQQNYEISINNNELTITIITNKSKFTLVKTEIPINDFIITNNKIRTENGGWWII